jgi:hypothetical protein
MNLGLKDPIGWNNVRHEPSGRFNVHCTNLETPSPVIISIVRHAVLCHPIFHGTSSMGKQLLAESEFAKLNELTELEVSEVTSTNVDETELAILKRQASRGI